MTRYHHIGYRRCLGVVHSVIVSTSSGIDWSVWEIPVESASEWCQKVRASHGLRFDEVIAKCGRVYQDVELNIPCLPAVAITQMLRTQAQRKAREEIKRQRGA